jgi:glycosyltransferase involved in cell wall biosynthesis
MIVIVGADPKYSNEHKGGVLTLSISLIEYCKKNNIDIKIINTLKNSFHKKNIIYNLIIGFKRVLILYKFLKYEKITGVILFTGANYSFYERTLMCLICNLYKTKTTLVIVDGFFFNVLNYNNLFKYIIILLLKVPTKIVATGTKWVELFTQLKVNKDKLITLYYWLPKNFEIKNYPKNIQNKAVINFIFVGWLVKEKGILEIVNALQKLKDDYFFNFTFVGNGPLYTFLRDKIEINNMQNFVFLKGWLNDTDYMKILDESDIFVLPSYAEGFPLSLIEALAYGLPCIVTDVGGITDSVINKKNGFIIRTNNSEDLYLAMLKYLKNVDLLNIHSIESLKIANLNHNVNINCSRLLNFNQ